MAGELFRRAANHGYQTGKVLNNVGYCLFAQGRIGEAAEFLRQAAIQDPELAGPHQLLARIELQKSLRPGGGCPDLDSIDRAIRLSRPNAEVFLDAACLYARRAKLTSDADERQRLVDGVFRVLERGFECGLQFDQLPVALLPLYSKLSADPRWHEMQARAPTQITYTKSELLVDPIDDVLAHSASAIAGPSPRISPAAVSVSARTRSVPGRSLIADP